MSRNKYFLDYSWNFWQFKKINLKNRNSRHLFWYFKQKNICIPFFNKKISNLYLVSFSNNNKTFLAVFNKKSAIFSLLYQKIRIYPILTKKKSVIFSLFSQSINNFWSLLTNNQFLAYFLNNKSILIIFFSFFPNLA